MQFVYWSVSARRGTPLGDNSVRTKKVAVYLLLCRRDPGGFGHCQLFFIFLLQCSCDKAHLLPGERKKEIHYANGPILLQLCSLQTLTQCCSNGGPPGLRRRHSIKTTLGQ